MGGRGMKRRPRDARCEQRQTRPAPFHLADIDLPLYVIQTKLSDGGVLRTAHTFIRQSKITRYKLIDDPDADHTDPLVDYPKRNRFLKTVVPFLKDTMRRAHAGTH